MENPYDVSPEERQAILAQVLRGQEALKAASARANQFSNMAAIAQLANNPGVAKAAALAHAQAFKANAPDQLGTQGYSLPTGEFVPSQMFLEDKAQARAQARGLQADRQQTLKDMQAEKLQAQRELQAQRDAAAWERAQLIATMRQSIAGAAGDRAKDKADAKIARDLSVDTDKFKAALEKAGAPEFAESLDIVKGAFAKYKEGELPGYGRFAGAVPDWAATDEMQTVRSDMQQAANILLKARSGAAVTDSEMRRFLTEVAQGKGMSEQAMRHGWANVERTFGARLKNLLSVSPEVYNEYVSRGGRDFRAGMQKEKGQGQDQVPPGVDLAIWKHMTPEEKKLWQK